jgi:hypothetical protein
LYDSWIDHTRTVREGSETTRSKDQQHQRIMQVLEASALPMDVENVRLKTNLKNWESTKAILLEMVLQGLIAGQKTTKSWVFWANSPAARSNNLALRETEQREGLAAYPRVVPHIRRTVRR